MTPNIPAVHSHDHATHDHDHARGRMQGISLAISGLLVSAGLLGQWTARLEPAFVAVISAAAMVAGGWFLLPKAGRALLRLRPDINLLVVIAAIGAAAVGSWSEAGVVVFLFGIAEWLESWADHRARRAVAALLRLKPTMATIRRDGGLTEVPVDEMGIGDRIFIPPGRTIPLDGEVVEGESSVNQAPITGEAVPVDRRAGDVVYAGTVNGEGLLEVRVTRRSGDTTLAHIIRLVAQAQEQKSPSERLVDRFAHYYTPAITALALAIFVVPPLLGGGAWSTWLYRACVLLVIACPCALVISTPVSVVAALASLARRGVLVKGGTHLEALGRLQVIALDKTGTVTRGMPNVNHVESLNGASESEILRIASAVDEPSGHPLARAIVAAARDRDLKGPTATKVRSLQGRGAAGSLDGHSYFVGNHQLTHELGICSPDIENRISRLEDEGMTVVVVGHQPHDACRGEAMGLIAIGDTVRPEAGEAVAALHRAGVHRVVMLSGDNRNAVTRIGRQVGFDAADGDLLPEAKVEAVRNLASDPGAVVAMVGDGVNDAPALAAATVGIAMGAAGSDAAIETADVALMDDDLRKIAEAVRLGRRALGIIRFNIVFAIALKALILVLALVGFAGLWLAILADTGATLLVVANALRLLQPARE